MRFVSCVAWGLLLFAGCCKPFASCVEVTAGKAEIVVPVKHAKAVDFAARELQGVLNRAFGSELAIVAEPTPGKVSIILGESVWAREAGVSVKDLPRDAFTISAKGDKICIVGRDADNDLAKAVAQGRVPSSERATLFGVYEFLERFAGVRFYFPGDIGTIVPKCKALAVPEGSFTVAPNFTVRSIYIDGDGAVPGETDNLSRTQWKAQAKLRLRLQTDYIPCCHGQRGFMFPERFHATHPEYFALLKRDGKTLKRDVGEHIVSDCDVQMCHSSKLWDEIYEDCKAYLSGQKADVRGIPSAWNKGKCGWNSNCHGRFIDVMAQDGMAECLCENCQKRYDKTTPHFATELVWGNTANLVNRLKKDGLKDFFITQMAYPPYRDVPKCALPPEVWVMVAEMGPWGCACPGKTDAELAEVRAWTQKLGHKIWMWTYPSKFGRKATPGAPDMAPRAWAKYYKATVPYSFGAFCESECEKSIFHYLNYYVFSKIAWNPNVDVEKLLAEHFSLMFGAAAPEMARFYDELEKKWTREVLCRWRDTKQGKDFNVASDVELWSKIYSPGVRDAWKALFKQAALKVQDDPQAAARLAFIKTEFLDYLVGKGEAFDRDTDVAFARARYAHLKPDENLFDKMTAPHHLVLTNDTSSSSKYFNLNGKLKPDTRYRISGIFKLKDVKPQGNRENGGCFFNGYAGAWEWYPRSGSVYSGTIDWVYRSFEFTTPKVLGTRTRHHMGFVMSRAVGEAWVDCLALEEIGKGETNKR